MKTKIIYISGNELFDMADIRSAFDEVRAALSLGPDTVLFGVPVDNDDALASQKTTENIIMPTTNDIAEPVVDTVQENIEPVILEEKKTSLRRAHKTTKVVPISEASTKKEPVLESDTKKTEEAEPIVPILSVLGSKSDDDANDADIVEPIEVKPETIDVVNDDNIEAEHVTITDMIADEAPVTEQEKTLEELLESMTPLGEDAEKDEIPAPKNDDVQDIDIETNKPSDNDITLEKLANEFVENQDKIGTPTKPATRGKIGKLKNILPFKKAKHDDSGLMGDLFGWAGVAANDEDFTIPGFFK